MYLLIFTLKTWQIDITPFPTNPRGKAKEIAEDSIIYIYINPVVQRFGMLILAFLVGFLRCLEAQWIFDT